MKLKYFLLVAMVLYGVGGVGFLINALPPPSLIDLNDAGAFLARAHGAAMIGWAVVFFLVRNERSAAALRAILLGNVCYLAIETTVLALAAASGVMAGWMGAITDALLLLGFAYFAFRSGSPEAAEAREG